MKHTVRMLLLVGMLAMPLGGAQQVSAQPARVAAAADESGQPQSYVLSAAYPNPFNPRTSFSLTVRETQPVRVEVFNLLGSPVKLLFNGTMEAGESKTFTFDAGELPSGIYLYRVQGKTFTATRQMTLLK